MEMDTSCRTQDTKQKKSPSWCVMLTLNRKGCKLFFYFSKIGEKFDDLKAELALCHRPKTEEKR